MNPGTGRADPFGKRSGGTKVTDAGVKDLAALQNLTTLSLGDTRVTVAGAQELQKALPRCKIQS